MKARWLVLPLLLAAVGWALAQSSVQLRPGDQGPLVWGVNGAATLSSPLTVAGAVTLSSTLSTAGHAINTGAAPGVTSCGGNPSIVGSDAGGSVTVGTTPTTSCIITFATAYGAAPACVLSPSSGVLAAFSYVITASAITVTQTSTASDIIQYVCVGKQ